MMSFLAAQSPTSADQQSVAAAIQAANSNAGITSESTVQSTLRQVQMQTSMLPAAMCPSQFTQHTQAAQQQQHAVMAAAAAQQQLQLASQPPGLTSKNKGDPRVEVSTSFTLC